MSTSIFATPLNQAPGVVELVEPEPLGTLMRIHLIAGLVGLSLCVAGFSTAEAATKCTKAKAKTVAKHSHKGHKVAHVRHRRGGAYLIPPPPASMPCILPELYYAKQHHPATGITEIAVEK
jgi:hypothetical protein